MSRFRTLTLGLTALAGAALMAFGASPALADGGEDESPSKSRFDLIILDEVQELSPPFEPDEQLAPEPTVTPVVGDPIAAIVCPDGTVVEYNPGEVDDPSELCDDEDEGPSIDVSDFCYDEDLGLVPCADDDKPNFELPDDVTVCIPPTHGENPCDEDDGGVDVGPDEPLGDCGDPESFPSYEDFADSCTFVECLGGSFPNHAVPMILCVDPNPVCEDLHNLDSFDAYYEECLREGGDEPDEVPGDDGDDAGDEPGDEPADDGDEPDGDGDSGDDGHEVVEQTEDDGDGADDDGASGSDDGGNKGNREVPDAPDAGTGAFESVPGGGMGMASLALIAAGGALAGLLLRRRA